MFLANKQPAGAIIIKSTQGRVVNPLRDIISLDLPVLQLRELINWQVCSLQEQRNNTNNPQQRSSDHHVVFSSLISKSIIPFYEERISTVIGQQLLLFSLLFNRAGTSSSALLQA
jgi:hypothetical protein